MNLGIKLQAAYPSLHFIQGSQFSWSPQSKTITYVSLKSQQDQWSLLHELGHAVLNHKTYQSDIGLLRHEVQAWERAKILGEDHGISIDWQHIEQCIDSYRDWLHSRSSCPKCRTTSFQVNTIEYHCANCNTRWRVSRSRLCRPHRTITKTAA